MADTLSNLSIISFIAAGVFFALAVFLWFFFRIPAVFGDLTGRTARKSIANMRAANEKSGAKSYRESQTNAVRGKLTDTMPGLEKAKGKKEAPKVPNMKKVPTGTLSDGGQPETGLLRENKEDNFQTEATGLLMRDEMTVPLEETVQLKADHKNGKKLTMIDEVMFIHTDEVIE